MAAEGAWLAIAGAAAAGLAASFLLDALARPRAPLRRRRLGAVAVQGGLHLLAFSLLLAICRRPLFAAGLVAAAQLLLILVSNAKVRALREPFVFSDFGLFSQALRHPRLYLPFLGVLPGLTLCGAFLLALYLGIALETSVLPGLGVVPFHGAVAAGAIIGIALAWLGARSAALALSLDPVQDVQNFGLVASVALYQFVEALELDTPVAPTCFTRACRARCAAPAAEGRPHIVAVQSESFFDARRLHPDIRRELLGHFDALLQGAELSGRLAVPAWGANTMRTEFAFLSGLPADCLGVHRFNPYRRYARQPVPTLATCLRMRGYRTVCIHPHPATFFGRDRVFANLGFDEFIDLDQFRDAPHAGPYVADAAVTRKIAEVLAASDRPTFVFAITMENHGPLHLEKVSRGEAPGFYRAPPPAGFEDLTVYLRHLAHADAMIGELAALLRAGGRNDLLCFFGDHVPSLPQVYAARGFADSSTDYFIWRPEGGPPRRVALAAENLAEQVLRAAGLFEGRQPASLPRRTSRPVGGVSFPLSPLGRGQGEG